MRRSMSSFSGVRSTISSHPTLSKPQISSFFNILS
jgi:hypothetical protein